MEKILFVGVLQKYNGARLGTEKNIDMLNDIYGSENVIKFGLFDMKEDMDDALKKYPDMNCRIAFKSKLKKYINLIQGYYPLISNSIENEIINKISEDKINKVFIDSAIFGRIAEKIRKRFKSNVKIITFFHDINIHLQKNYHNEKSNLSKIEYLKRAPYLSVSVLNEKRAIEYSDSIIILNSRDYSMLKRYYTFEGKVNFIPVSLKDDVEVGKHNHQVLSKPTVLFVGIEHHLPNVSGVLWFINNVLPFVNIKFQIAGRGMENLESKFCEEAGENKNKIEVLGTVDDIDKCYEEADLIVAPIFDGGGMKIKVAEALKYGKYILGTEEAFEGYEIIQNVHGTTFYKAEDCIKFFSSMNLVNSYNEPSRKLFLEKYSYQAVKKKFEEALF